MERILISGANGFIGSHLTDFCIEKNYTVYGLERPNQMYRNLSHYTDEKLNFSENEKTRIFNENIEIPTNNKKLRIFECDIKNAQLLEKIIAETKPKFLFHFSAEYGTTTSINRPLKESDPLLAIHPYGISKVATELLARQYFINFGIEVINLRFFNQTGPRRKGDATSDFIRKVAQIELGLSEPVIEVGNLEPYRDFTEIKDSLKAIWLAATMGIPGETYNICSSKKLQIRQILDIALSFSLKKIEVKENVSHKLRKTDEDVILGDNSKIKNELGWDVSIPIEETLRDMFEYWLDYYKKYGV